MDTNPFTILNRARSLEHAEEVLRGMGTLSFGFMSYVPKTIEELIDVILIDCPDTYCNDKLQCPRSRRRSGGDIYRIVRHYYPEVTLLDVLKLIKQAKCHSSVCLGIRKRIYKKYVTIPQVDFNYYSELVDTDELGQTYEFYKNL